MQWHPHLHARPQGETPTADAAAAAAVLAADFPGDQVQSIVSSWANACMICPPVLLLAAVACQEGLVSQCHQLLVGENFRRGIHDVDTANRQLLSPCVTVRCATEYRLKISEARL